MAVAAGEGAKQQQEGGNQSNDEDNQSHNEDESVKKPTKRNLVEAHAGTRFFTEPTPSANTLHADTP